MSLQPGEPVPVGYKQSATERADRQRDKCLGCSRPFMRGADPKYCNRCIEQKRRELESWNVGEGIVVDRRYS